MTRVGASLEEERRKEQRSRGAEKERRLTRLVVGKEKKDRQHSGANTDVARASQSDQVLDGKPAD